MNCILIFCILITAEITTPLLSFNAGEILPDMEQRSDFEKYDNACRELENMLVLTQGPAVRRPGMKLVSIPVELELGYEYEEPNGTEITTVAGLQAISDDLSGTYYLAADIDCSGINWTPIATSGTPFTGTFDGRYYTINNLYINTTSISGYYGLFGYCNGATIKNLKIYDADLTTKSAIGILAGMMVDCNVTQVAVTGEMNIGSNHCGGFVGGDPGGLGGNKFTRCSAIVTINTPGSVWVGGFSGSNQGEFVDCYAECEINGTRWDCGGFIGTVNLGGNSFTRCYSVGSLEEQVDNDNDTAGGFTGNILDETVIFSDCYFLETLNAKAYSGDDEQQKVQLSSSDGAPTGGTYTITWDGNTTSNIAYNATEAVCQAAVDAAMGEDVIDVSIGNFAKSASAVMYLFFRGDYSRTDVSMASVDTSGLTGPGSPYTNTVTEFSSYSYPTNTVEPSSTSDANMKKQATFTNFDFNDVWEIDEGYDYPRHQWLDYRPFVWDVTPYRLISFEYSTTDAYVIEIGNECMRFYREQ